MSLLGDLQARLDELEQQAERRRLTTPRGIDFCSNDYLGLSADSAFREAFETRRAMLSDHELLSPASRLLRGQSRHHASFEKRFADFKRQPAGLLFPSGYQANVGVLSALIGPRDRVLSDELNHASLIDGLRLSGCRKVIYRHGDATHVRELLSRPWADGRTFLVTESLFSMEGDRAPLAEFAELAARGLCELIVDEAHATGLYGPDGAGLIAADDLEDTVMAVISTLGKAFGLSGAVVTGSPTLIDYLVNRSRSFVFSTAVPPLLVAALEAALDVVEAEPRRRGRLRRRSALLRLRLEQQGVAFSGLDSPIVPIPVGGNRDVVQLAAGLQADGFDVRAIRPPTVPRGTSRLRISVHASHTAAEIEGLAAAVGRRAGRAVPAEARP